MLSHDIEQGSEAWRKIRLGKLTASRLSDALAKTKSGWGASRANLMAELMVERLTGEVTATFTNAAMQWGTDKEPEACAAYAFRHDVDLETVGFVDHPTILMAGASPDRLVGADGLVEVKCPNTANHLETLRVGSISGRYLTQMMWQMACTGRAWCDFVSYDPRLPEAMRLFVQRVPRDEALVAELEREARAFLGELDALVADLNARYARAA